LLLVGWKEKILYLLKTNKIVYKKSFFKNLSFNLASNIWQTTLLLILTPFYVSILGIESYGLIGFYTILLAIVGVIDTGISATMTREIAWRAAKKTNNIIILIRSMEWIYWCIVVLFGLFSFFISKYFGYDWFNTSSISPNIVKESLMLMSVLLIFQVPSGFYIGGFIGLQRQSVSAVIMVIFSSIRGLGSIIVITSIAPDIRVFFIWQIFLSMLQTIALRQYLYKESSFTNQVARFSFDALYTVKDFASKMIVITIIGVIISQLDKFMLSKLISMESFGYYMLAWTVASGLSRLATPLVQVVSPFLTESVSKNNTKILHSKISFSTRVSSNILIPPALLIIIFPDLIVWLWIGDEYIVENVKSILPFVVFGALMTSIAHVSLSVLYSKSELEYVIKANIIISIFMIPAIYFAVFYFGILGAAVISSTYGCIQYIAYTTKVNKNKLFSSTVLDFIYPFIVVFIVIKFGQYIVVYSEMTNKIYLLIALVLVLLLGWYVALILLFSSKNTGKFL
jgi:O-antigen/teichoic acid export membrane protein